MKIVFTFLFLLAAVYSNAQNNDLIVGNWIFKKALNENIDEQGAAHLKAEVIDKWKFIFNQDGSFETSLMGLNQTGAWTMSSDSNSITLTGLEGAPMEFKILHITGNELALKFGLGEFLLKRIKE